MEPIYVTTEAVNAYGFRVLTDGIMLDAFLANPVMTYNHIRTVKYSDAGKIVFPIGRWEQVKKDGSRMAMSPVFNEKYEYGAQSKQMYEDKFLNAASISIEILEMSEDPKQMLPGQTRPTVTKCRLREVALTDIPVNWTCHRLTYRGKDVDLSADKDNEAIDEILPIIEFTKSKPMEKTGSELSVVAIGLGLEEGASTAQVLAKATEYMNRSISLAAEVDTLRAGRQKLEARIAELEKTGKDAQLSILLDEAVNSGKITKAQRPHFEALGKENYDTLKAALDSMQAYTPPTTKTDGGKPGGGGGSTEEALAAQYDELDKEGKLAQLSDEERNTLLAAKQAVLRKSGKAKVK